MNVLGIIDKKRKGLELNLEEIKFLIDGFMQDAVKDYQISAFLMAVCINGLTDSETFYLTDVLISSGDIIDFDGIEGVITDKHSTGGVGDKTTLIVAPLVAACGVNVIKVSGRGLGHTGGTIDKLESIKGFKVNLSKKDLIRQVNEINAALVSQTENLVPADKKIYHLRDVTATTSSIPLIAASIMSKKIATNSTKIVIDLKVGSGALINNLYDARKLAHLMIKIGEKYEREVICLLTNMDVPLGKAIGNGLEVKEAILTLKGKGPKDLEKLSVSLASYMVSMAKDVPLKVAFAEVMDALKSLKGYDKFKQIIEYQKGDIKDISVKRDRISIKSKKSGYIKSINALKFGEAARDIKAGRFSKNDTIDYEVGFYLNKTVGDKVVEGEDLFTAFTNTEYDFNKLLDAYEFSIKKEEQVLIYEVIK